VLIALKRVLIKKLVERFRRDAELLRSVCDHVERHLDESRLVIADWFQSLNEGVLRKANIELEHLNRQLRDLGRFKDRLMSNISHEFKTPLSSVRGYAELMLEGMMGPVSTEQERGLSISLKSIDRLNVMIEELLFYSRMTEKKRPTLRPERFRLKDIVSECVETVKPDAGKKEILLQTGSFPADLLIHADKMKIHQAVTSLLSNAIKFNRTGGRVDVSFFRRGRNAVIRIHDTGIGVPEEARTKIFKAFFQLNASESRPYEGMGLGLAIVRENIRLHGGRVDLISKKGEGATFEITLPLTQEKTVFFHE